VDDDVIEGAKYREFSASKDTEKGETVTKRGSPLIAEQSIGTDRVNLVSDMLLAGVVTSGFAMFYNAAWAQIAMAAVGFVSTFIARSPRFLLQFEELGRAANHCRYTWRCIASMPGGGRAYAGARRPGPRSDGGDRKN
jgi:hypothetical protein